VFGSSSHEGRNVYFTLAFAGIALMAAVFVGVAVAKYRAARSPHAQGFVEVDQVRFNFRKIIKQYFNISKFISQPDRCCSSNT
jgi:hypothetical protein